MAFSADGRERLSNGRTFDYGGTIYLSTGNVLWSDRWVTNSFAEVDEPTSIARIEAGCASTACES